ncbi:Flagellar biosynthetic protein FliQ [Buchnera aphidicola (Cinara cuneomaculata)]|uniref:Flagellar biosynthetic protein FliQ n=1 Tax=Buchnera aphidicola (Cinara cuneomaculata) TaxID=1660040 RepID=A0A451CY26_9GAMM|nr:flagellar biosynthetic protein FliQ [Buchnera aphidicola]VFP78036.1 Flagellar biosynthetic protein FliQ [Buchnera aphidicola (Cinara cuneomaculata)]
MNQEFLMILFQDSIQFALLLSAPCLLSILFSGLLMSIFQASTQITEQTLSFIPKIISVVLSCIVFGPWMLQITLEYINNIFHIISIISSSS